MSAFTKPVITPGAKTLPALWYVSDDVFRHERERIFAHDWIGIGRAEWIPNAGDFFLAELAGESLIVTRDRAGKVHAFYNVCRHRGTRLCQQSTGHFQGSIQCPYHAWTYGLDGALSVARNMAEVPGFDRSEYPLHEAAVTTWEGFIFASIAPQPETFERALAP
ncbi:MAG: Rieske (2Fe-2S) protein, partial [Candidatus Eremiobacteraeota bacterium]|nr:Rieske (2Fe-2S) protein [Candidatus Eremiobacteraeota bacterium]